MDYDLGKALEEINMKLEYLIAKLAPVKKEEKKKEEE
jgi:hypothetical protein